MPHIVLKAVTKLKNWITVPKNRRLVIILGLLFLYLSGFVAQILRNQHSWIPGRGLSPPSLNPIRCLRSLFSPQGIQAMAGILLTALILLLTWYLFREDKSHMRYDRKRKFWYSSKGTYGTAAWMSESELRENFVLTPESDAAKAGGIIYGVKDGMIVSRRPDSPLAEHTAVFGASGSMKSRAYVRNAIISAAMSSRSIVASDPKAELYSDMAGYLEDCGYIVKVLNLVNPEQSDRMDGLDGATTNPLYVSHVVEAVISNTGGPKGDAFFDAAEGYLLSALVFHELEKENPTGEYPTLGAAYRLLLETESLEHLAARFAELPPGSHGAMKYNLFSKASTNLQGNVMIGLAARLQVLEHEEIAELMSFPDLDFTRPGREKCAYFLILSDQDTTMRFVSAMFFSLLFSRLVYYADNHCEGKRLPVEVMLILDEYCNLVGAIKDFHIKVSTIRSRGMIVAICCQGIGQLQNRHPDNVWSEILGSMDTVLCLGCNEQISADYFSEATGEVSIAVDTVMKQKNSMNPMWFQPTFRQSEGIGRRRLMTTDEIRRMPHDIMLLFVRGQQVLELQKFDYSRHSESGKLRPAAPCKPLRSLPAKNRSEEKAPPQDAVPQPIPDTQDAAVLPAAPVFTKKKPRRRQPQHKTDPRFGEQMMFPECRANAWGPEMGKDDAEEVMPDVEHTHEPEVVKAAANPDL